MARDLSAAELRGRRFALIIAFVQRYVAKAGIGTQVLPMLPHSLTFLVGWSLLFIVWMLLGWPVGPGVPTSLPVAGLTSN